MVYKPPGTSTSTRGISPQRPQYPVANQRGDIQQQRGRRRGALPGEALHGTGYSNSVRSKLNNHVTPGDRGTGTSGSVGGGMKRSNSLNNKYNNNATTTQPTRRSNSIERMNNGKVYRGRSPLRNSTSNLSTTTGAIGNPNGTVRNHPVLIRSRGNEVV
uniref:Uncharacterized protein n=1 Tax=Anopheles maculatus TaxID=74869 RepID=A0A182S656_9DIPT